MSQVTHQRAQSAAKRILRTSQSKPELRMGQRSISPDEGSQTRLHTQEGGSRKAPQSAKGRNLLSNKSKTSKLSQQFISTKVGTIESINENTGSRPGSRLTTLLHKKQQQRPLTGVASPDKKTQKKRGSQLGSQDSQVPGSSVKGGKLLMLENYGKALTRPMTGVNQMTRVQSLKQTNFPLASTMGRPMTGIHNFAATSSQGDLFSQSDMPIDIKLATVRSNLAKKNNLSTWTKEENDTAKHTINVINYLEQDLQKKSSLAHLEKMDCKNMLLIANREIKTMQYALNCIVQSGESVNILRPGKPSEIEVIPETYMTFNLQVRGQLSPAKFKIVYRESAKTTIVSDLKVFISTVNSEPREHSCQKMFTNPDFFVIGSQNKKDFDSTDNINVCLYSIAGCSITLKTAFPKKKERRSNRDQQEEDANQRKNTVNKDKDHDDSFEVRRKHKQEIVGVDFVKKNLELVNDWPEQQQEKMFKIRTKWVRVQTAKTRKEQIEFNKMKMNVFQLHRWNFIKDFRQEKYAEAMELRMERYRKHTWTKHINLIQVLKHLYLIFDQRREKATRQAKTTFAVNMFAIKFRLWSQKKAKTIEGRNAHKAKECFTFYGNAKTEATSVQAAKVVKMLLTETGEIYDLKQKFRVFYRKMECIQRVFKNRMRIFKEKEFFLRVFFDKCVQVLIKQCMGKKTQRKQNLLKRLTVIDESVKMAVLRAWIKRCKLRFMGRYIEWRLEYYLNAAPDNVREIEIAKMKKLYAKQEQSEKLLLQGVLLVDEEPLPVASDQPPVQAKAAPAKPAPKGNAKDKGKQPPAPVEPPKPVLTAFQVMKKNLLYPDGSDGLYSESPYFRFMPPNRETMQRLIIRACNAKGEKDFASIL